MEKRGKTAGVESVGIRSRFQLPGDAELVPRAECVVKGSWIARTGRRRSSCRGDSHSDAIDARQATILAVGEIIDEHRQCSLLVSPGDAEPRPDQAQVFFREDPIRHALHEAILFLQDCDPTLCSSGWRIRADDPRDVGREFATEGRQCRQSQPKARRPMVRLFAARSRGVAETVCPEKAEHLVVATGLQSLRPDDQGGCVFRGITG